MVGSIRSTDLLSLSLSGQPAGDLRSSTPGSGRPPHLCAPSSIATQLSFLSARGRETGDAVRERCDQRRIGSSACSSAPSPLTTSTYC
ncbi:hypothetical protein SETIT_9G488100v2 [Setaria italica]|uniref:Uncharacterized protein n=1 Tax=Setaria italica TaxID=4555 RepID=A0A368STW2_SETIT|nr:hypothetical protein SETIT_9G488100v2 [Setaria italica]